MYVLDVYSFVEFFFLCCDLFICIMFWCLVFIFFLRIVFILILDRLVLIGWILFLEFENNV